MLSILTASTLNLFNKFLNSLGFNLRIFAPPSVAPGNARKQNHCSARHHNHHNHDLTSHLSPGLLVVTNSLSHKSICGNRFWSLFFTAGLEHVNLRPMSAGQTRPVPAFPDDPWGWLSLGRFALALVLVLLISFPQVLAGYETFGYLDFGQFAYPVAFYHRESFWRGELPLWNALSNCGTPFLAQWNTLTCYPLSLFYLLLPFPWSLCVFCLLHLFIGGMGMYLLAERWTGQRFAAAVAGFGFAFNGMTWYGLLWPHITAALAWMPWVVLAMERSWNEGRRAIVWGGAIAGLQWLSGGAEVIALTWLVVGAWWGIQVITEKKPVGKGLFRAAGAALLGVGLAAFQLLPFVDLLLHSQRSAGYANTNLAVMPLTGLANYIVPAFHCLRNPQGLLVPPDHWTGSYYAGIGVAFLAVMALWKARSRMVWFLTALCLFSWAMALGQQGFIYNGATHLLPFLGFMRFPIKFVMLATFTLPLLAGFGAGWLAQAPVQPRSAEWKSLGTLLAGFLAIIGLLVGWAWAKPFLPGEGPVVTGNALMRAVFLVLVVICLFTLRTVKDVKAARWFQCATIGLFWLDIFTHNANLSPTVPPAVFEPNAVRNYYHWTNQLETGSDRLMESPAAFHTLMQAEFRQLEHDTAARRLAQFFDYNLLDHVPKFDGFYSLELKYFSDLLHRIYGSTNTSVPKGVLDLAGISHINSSSSLAEWLDRDSYLPLLTGGQKPVFAGDPETLEAVLRNDFEPRQVAYLPNEAQAAVHAQPCHVLISNQVVSSTTLQAEVEASESALLVVAQTFYHPWHAFVDGASVPLWRADYAFQAFEVQPGKHHLLLAYDDIGFKFGVTITAFSSLVAIGLWFRSRRREAQLQNGHAAS